MANTPMQMPLERACDHTNVVQHGGSGTSMGIAANKVACIVLAAGRSTRFGDTDKLATLFHGVPLLHHILGTLGRFDFARKIVVCQPAGPDVSALGFDRIEIAGVDTLQSDSLRAGIGALGDHPVAGILLALGDMPAVSRAHIDRLLGRFDPGDDRCVVASAMGDACLPPAVFASGLAGELARMTGDQGARPLLRGAVPIPVSHVELVDVDTPADLERMSTPRDDLNPTSQKCP